jgi:hypothetical protein
MAAIELPDRGQPLDISYLLRIATEINSLNQRISTGGTQSSLKYLGNNNTTRVITSDLVTYSASQQVSGDLQTTRSALRTTFNFSFKTTPIVVASVEYVSGEVSIFPVIQNVGPSGCSVFLESPKSTGTVSANISIIAIGERV